MRPEELAPASYGSLEDALYSHAARMTVAATHQWRDGTEMLVLCLGAPGESFVAEGVWEPPPANPLRVLNAAARHVWRDPEAVEVLYAAYDACATPANVADLNRHYAVHVARRNGSSIPEEGL